MKPKSVRWTVAQKAAALGSLSGKLETITVDLDANLVRFASREARKLGVPRDVFLGIRLQDYVRGRQGVAS